MWFINHEMIDHISLSRWMGMPNEKVVAKYAARMGLVSVSHFRHSPKALQCQSCSGL